MVLHHGGSHDFCEVLVVDFSSSISSLSFTDLDLDPLELGGVIAWNEPGMPSSRGLGEAWENNAEMDGDGGITLLDGEALP